MPSGEYRIGNGGWRAAFSPRWGRHFRRMSLFKKTMIVNAIVILFGAVAGTYLTRLLVAQHSPLALSLLFFTCGALITILANYLAFSDHFRPLVEINRALEAIRRGQEARRALEGVRESGFSGLLDSVRTLLERIEDDSLQFSAKLLGSIEEERQRIGRDLHDNTIQLLAAAHLRLSLVERDLAADAPATREALSNVREIVERALGQLKTVIYDLRPAMLKDLGLVAALRWYINARVRQPGIEVATRILNEERRLPPDSETALYRVAQEALGNAVLHSGATRVDLSLEYHPGFIVLGVFDNGRGFDLAVARGRGLGLLSMQERIAMLGGRFNIVTEPGEGTRVYAVVPIEDAAGGGESSE